MPPKALRKLAEAFAANLTAELETLELAHQGVSWYASPRRLGLRVIALDAKQQDKEVEKRGPAIKAAFDADGNPTKAAMGCPYILMNPRLILAAIAGGMTGVFVLTMFNAGIVSPASPGSIFAILLMTQKGSIVGVLASIAAATGVSFAVAALLMKTQTSTEEDGDEAALEKATSQMKDMKSAIFAERTFDAVHFDGVKHAHVVTHLNP